MNLDKYMSIPFKEKGRDSTGCDCWGLARMILQENLGVELPSYSGDYFSTHDRGGVREAIEEGLKNWRKVDHPAKWDLVVFRIGSKRSHSKGHVGVCLGEGRFIHCPEDCSVCTERLSSPVWKDRIEGFYSYV